MTKNKLTKKQLEIVRGLEGVIVKYGLQGKLSSETIIDWVWSAQDNSVLEAFNAYQKKCFKFFRKVNSLDEMNCILQIFVEAWNHFPHQALGGESPNQLVKKVRGVDTGAKGLQKTDSKSMPTIICGGHEFTWDEYWAMIKQCEREQKPFRAWIEKQVLPAYVNYLHGQYKSKKVVEKHERIADIFFDRALSLGFVTFEQIHARFVWDDFPIWWQTHILDDDQTKDQLCRSLDILSLFLSDKYARILPIE